MAALLAIARRQAEKKIDSVASLIPGEEPEDGWVCVLDEDLEKLVLWVEIKQQIEILREGMEDK